jgi:hypothetical protein
MKTRIRDLIAKWKSDIKPTQYIPGSEVTACLDLIERWLDGEATAEDAKLHAGAIGTNRRLAEAGKSFDWRVMHIASGIWYQSLGMKENAECALRCAI